MGTLEQRVQRLQDITDIRRLKIEYAQQCDDNYNPDGLTALFTDDAVWEGTGLGRYEGKQAIHGFWTDASGRFTFALHYMVGDAIDIAPSGVEATGHWYLWEPATIDGRAMFVAATYDDVYKKVDGRWLFHRVQAHSHFLAPYESGWVKVPFAELD